MTRTLAPPTTGARPCFAADLASQLVIAAAMLAGLILFLLAVGRPLACPCGSVSLWVGDVHSPESSQQFADWYSLLHVVFGFGLWLFMDWMKPHWTFGQKLLVAIASSCAWEMVENLPPVIAMFGDAPNAPSYSGDSVVNALGDTLFVGLGFALASAVPVWAVLALAVGSELLVWHVASDGYLLGTLRLVGIPV